jgi:hypothetical protein
MSTQVSQQPNMMASTSFPTPENSVIGQTRKAPDEFEEGHVTKRPRMDDEATLAQGERGRELNPPTDNSLRELEPPPSDQQLAASGSISNAEIKPQTVANEATQPASVEMSLRQLQKNVGEAFHLCKSGKIPFSLPLNIWRTETMMLTFTN